MLRKSPGRALIVKIPDDGRWQLTFWEGPEVSTRDPDRGTVVEEDWPWVAEHSHRRQPIVISSLDELPAWTVNGREAVFQPGGR